MEFTKERTAYSLTYTLSGQLDSSSAPRLKEDVDASLKGVTELILDMAGLDYLSSAGLRVLISAQKVMNRQGVMLIRHVCPDIMNVFEVTGCLDIFTLQ